MNNNFLSKEKYFEDCLESWAKWQNGAAITMLDDVRAFAIHWAGAEMKAIGRDPEKETGGELFHGRLLAWTAARLQWHQYDIKVRCRDAESPNKEIAEAAFVGWTQVDAKNPDPKSPKSVPDERLSAEWLANLSDSARKAFFKAATGQSVPSSRHYHLDSWLINIWPIVMAGCWTYRDVQESAMKKFPMESTDSYPLDSWDNMRKHCHGLNLKTNSKRRKRGTSPPLLDVALRIEV